MRQQNFLPTSFDTSIPWKQFWTCCSRLVNKWISSLHSLIKIKNGIEKSVPSWFRCKMQAARIIYNNRRNGSCKPLSRSGWNSFGISTRHSSFIVLFTNSQILDRKSGKVIPTQDSVLSSSTDKCRKYLPVFPSVRSIVLESHKKPVWIGSEIYDTSIDSLSWCALVLWSMLLSANKTERGRCCYRRSKK
jgi:hypothetical protein